MIIIFHTKGHDVFIKRQYNPFVREGTLRDRHTDDATHDDSNRKRKGNIPLHFFNSANIRGKPASDRPTGTNLYEVVRVELV
jgi:hypothetical protein